MLGYHGDRSNQTRLQISLAIFPCSSNPIEILSVFPLWQSDHYMIRIFVMTQKLVLIASCFTLIVSIDRLSSLNSKNWQINLDSLFCVHRNTNEVNQCAMVDSKLLMPCCLLNWFSSFPLNPQVIEVAMLRALGLIVHFNWLHLVPKGDMECQWNLKGNF